MVRIIRKSKAEQSLCNKLILAQIIQFQQLHMLLAGGQGLTEASLLKILPKVANLVRGNWVVKSEVLYPDKTFSATSGVPAELMCRTRDYVVSFVSHVCYYINTFCHIQGFA